LLSWPRQIPIEGQPVDVVKVVEAYSNWLAQSETPKLYIHCEPGAFDKGRPREFCRNWPNQKEVNVKGLHFVQEDSSDDIGIALANFVRELRSN
jgi:haloalkane dehalogenase